MRAPRKRSRTDEHSTNPVLKHAVSGDRRGNLSAYAKLSPVERDVRRFLGGPFDFLPVRQYVLARRWNSIGRGYRMMDTRLNCYWPCFRRIRIAQTAFEPSSL